MSVFEFEIVPLTAKHNITTIVCNKITSDGEWNSFAAQSFFRRKIL